jgi:hypothetical protein
MFKKLGFGLALLVFLGSIVALAVIVFAVIGFGEKVGAPAWNAGEWFDKPVEVTPVAAEAKAPIAEKPVVEAPAVEEVAPEDVFLSNFNKADEDFTGKFGYQPQAIVFVMTDAERLSCVVPAEVVDEMSDVFGWYIFEDVFQEGDTIETDIRAMISSTDAIAYDNCWEMPVADEFYRAMVIGSDPVGREAELEKATGGTLYTVIRDTDSGKESSVPVVLDSDITEYDGHNVIVIRYQLSGFDIEPAYIYPTFSPYIAP